MEEVDTVVILIDTEVLEVEFDVLVEEILELVELVELLVELVEKVLAEVEEVEVVVPVGNKKKVAIPQAHCAELIPKLADCEPPATTN